MTTENLHYPHLKYRADIDGLRALAILSVLVFHAFPQSLPGGFIGVDIFFVISGYLITGIILKSQHQGGLNLLEFYSRRIKRIFPALILVLVCCLAVGWHLLHADEFQSLGKHVAAGAVYISNIVLMGESGYFDQAAELKPLLHLWSLGIEEQFYLVWPLVMILSFRIKLKPLVTILPLLLVSFLLNTAFIDADPVKVFYLPFTRAWELMIGSALAYLSYMKATALNIFLSKPSWLGQKATLSSQADCLAWIGVLLILFSLTMLHKDSAFPGWAALLPTAGGACLIAAGERAWLNQVVFANRYIVFIGLISYPLYLWHWPLLSFAHIVEIETPRWEVRIGVLVLSALLATATYLLVERRLRFRLHWMVAPGLLMALIMVGLAGYAVVRHEGYPNRIKKIDPRANELGAANWAAKGLNAQKPCMEKFGEGYGDYCMIQEIEKPPTVLLLGDSTANHFFPGLARNYMKKGENLLNLGQGGCPPFSGVEVTMAEGVLHCMKVTENLLNFAEKNETIKTVVFSAAGAAYISGNRSLYNKGKENNFVQIELFDRKGASPAEVFREALRKTMRRLVVSGKEIIFVTSIPRLNFNPAICLDARPWGGHFTVRKSCAISRMDVAADGGAYQALALEVLREFPSVKVWDTTKDICDDEFCWAMKDGVLLYRDDVHLSESGTYWLGERYKPE